MFDALGGDAITVPASGSAVVRAGGAWVPSGTPGFWMMPLVEDAAAGLRTYLMRTDAGASAALHNHDEIEQVYVIEGHFRDEMAEYGPGDLIVRAAGAPHIAVSDGPSLSLVIYAAPRAAAAS